MAKISPSAFARLSTWRDRCTSLRALSMEASRQPARVLRVFAGDDHSDPAALDLDRGQRAESQLVVRPGSQRGHADDLCPSLRRLLPFRRRHQPAWPDHQHATGALHAIQLETSWPRSWPHPSLVSARGYGELERSQHRPAFPLHGSEPPTRSGTAGRCKLR